MGSSQCCQTFWAYLRYIDYFWKVVKVNKALASNKVVILTSSIYTHSRIPCPAHPQISSREVSLLSFPKQLEIRIFVVKLEKFFVSFF